MTYITVGTGSVYSIFSLNLCRTQILVTMFSTCNSGVIFPICQIPGSHHPGLTVLFPKKVLSPSQSLTYVSILYCILKKVKNKIIHNLRHLFKIKFFIYRSKIIFYHCMRSYCHTNIILIVTKINIFSTTKKSHYWS